MLEFEKIGDLYWATLTLKNGKKVENFFPSVHEALMWAHGVIQNNKY